MAGSHQKNNRLSVAIKCTKFLDYREILASRKRLCAMELVGRLVQMSVGQTTQH